jgi:hypothetical protein
VQINCPHCGFTKEIDETKVPAGAKTATCPKCREKFELKLDQPAGASAPPPPPPPPSMEPEMEQPGASYGAPPSMPETPAYQEPGMGAAPPPPLPGQPSYAQPTPTVDIPWESRSGSFFGDYFATVKMVLFKPGTFFSSMPVDAGLGKPLVFAIINGIIGFFFLMLWQMLLMMIGVGLSGDMAGGMGAAVGGGALGMIIFVIISPIFVVLGMFIGSAILHLFLLIVRGADSGYQATFRTMGYATAAYLAYIIPIVGGLVGGIWALILMIIGLAKAHRTGIGRVIIAVIVIPIVLVILLSILAGILAAVLAS